MSKVEGNMNLGTRYINGTKSHRCTKPKMAEEMDRGESTDGLKGLTLCYSRMDITNICRCYID